VGEQWVRRKVGLDVGAGGGGGMFAGLEGIPKASEIPMQTIHNLSLELGEGRKKERKKASKQEGFMSCDYISL